MNLSAMGLVPPPPSPYFPRWRNRVLMLLRAQTVLYIFIGKMSLMSILLSGYRMVICHRLDTFFDEAGEIEQV